MSEKYLPLFRKYRPQSFKDVVGQESLTKALSNAIELNKIANAYLFSGPRGTGKTSCARIFAKSLNCVNGPTLEPCQKCPSCLDITNASGLDVIEIDAATNRGIDDAKELIAQTQYAPMNGKYKIFIIDEVHMLSNEAFNALLKTFEEPPANVIFILATTEPHKVIETIVSRCQRFDLRRITTDDITKRLREVSDLENIKITDDALYTIAKNVSGGLRDSLALLDQVSILGAKTEITKEDIENLLGKMTFDVSISFLEKVLSQNTQEAIFYIDEIYNKGLEPKNFCENFIEFLRNLIFALSSSDEKNILKFTNFNACDIEKIRSLNFDSAKIFKILNKVIEYYKEIRLATNPYLWVELMIINLCRINETENSTAQASAIAQAAQNSAPVQNIQTSKPAVQPAAPSMRQPQIPQVQIQPAAKKQPEIQPQSLVKETLQEINIPEKEVIEEKPKNNEPEHLMEYKEGLYENADESLKTSANVQDVAVQKEQFKETKSEPGLPMVPGVDDVFAQQNPPVQIQNTAPASASVDESNPAALWASVLNVIELLPAKFFFSSRKLINIKDKKVTLGFVNDKLIEQAKSDSKYKHLDKAVKSVLGPDYAIEFIIMTPDIKPIDVKITAKVQTPQPRTYQNNQAAQTAPVQAVQNSSTDASKEDIEKEMLADMTPPIKDKMPDGTGDTEANNGNKAKKTSVSHYGKKTQEMLEAFNGKVID